jgi:hypothetical protein
MELMQIVDHAIIEGNGNLTHFDKEKLLAGLGAMDQVQFNQVFGHIQSLQHFFDRFSSGFWTDEERFLSPDEVGKNVLKMEGLFL